MEDARIGGGRRFLAPLDPLRARLARHEALLWWLHSAYVLALGAGIVWLGARNFAWLRYSGFYLVAIWLLSLFLSNVVSTREGAWWNRARVLVNYVNKNLYQQLLFFILPIYAGSTTWRSRNVLFLALLAASAVLSTLDRVYDRVLSARRALAAWFFAFNVFAVINVALPVMFGVGALRSARFATLAAAAGFVTLAWRIGRLGRAATWVRAAAGAALILAAGEFARPLVPPAPLRLGATEFGAEIDREAMRVTGPMTALPRDGKGRVYAVTAVRAPLGLSDRVELRWFRNSTRLSVSGPYALSGGRREGYRLWSAVDLGRASGAGELRLEVLTEGGQLVGAARLGQAR